MFRLAKPTPGLVLLLLVPAFLILRSRLQHTSPEPEATPFIVNTDVTPVKTKPFFSLSTNRTFGTLENPRLWLDHRGIDSLDFRVYRRESDLQPSDGEPLFPSSGVSPRSDRRIEFRQSVVSS